MSPQALRVALKHTDYHSRLRLLHRELGIPPDYARRTGLPVYEEPEELVATEPDFLGRPQRLTPPAYAAWVRMRRAAADDGVVLFLVSAFRDLEYQGDLIRRKLDRGQTIETILEVNAAPGYSEHHSGRAVDIGTPDCEVLLEKFENTTAFQWLKRHSADFGFQLSYPVSNAHGIAYEPWHWCYRDSKKSP